MSDNPLASRLTLPCGAVLPNRIMKAAMTEGLADPLGRVTGRLVTLYRRWSAGGAGLLITGNVMIDRRYLERPGNVVIDDNGGLDALARLTEAGTANGNHLWMQINHPGRQCARISSNHPVAPSAVQLRILGNFARPRALTSDEVTAVIGEYARVAATARDTGFTGVQIHAAHGYLISQFLSPHTNRRTDRWGGSLARRARFLLEIVRACRAAVGPVFPIGVKLNSADFQKGGFTLEESCQVAAWLAQEGVDLLEISGGTYEQPRLLGLEGDPHATAEPKRASTRRREAYFLEYAQAIREAATLPLAVTGGLRDPRVMEDALRAGRLDVVGLARPLCMNPDLPAELVAGEAAPAPRHEDDLRLGDGLLRPTSPIAGIRALNSQGSAAWYYRQILRLADDLTPDPALPFGRALRQHFIDEYRIGLARRRQLRR